ncbi:MAG: hypothetical protein KF866_02760 [Phycisphaeraceae bacterium]|nr:hypothetical protein [Phycisphaeraceae bacterium]
MNAIAFLVVAWVLLGLQLGLSETLRLGISGPAPDLLLVLAAFAALQAPVRTALWTAFLLGLVTDLTWTVARPGGSAVPVFGPHALGYVLGAQAIVSIRGNLIRRNPLTLGAVTLIAGVIAGVLVVAMMTLRTTYDPIVWRAGSELATRMGAAVYSGVAGVITAFALLPLTPILGLGTTTGRVGRWTVR